MEGGASSGSEGNSLWLSSEDQSIGAVAPGAVVEFVPQEEGATGVEISRVS